MVLLWISLDCILGSFFRSILNSLEFSFLQLVNLSTKYLISLEKFISGSVNGFFLICSFLLVYSSFSFISPNIVSLVFHSSCPIISVSEVLASCFSSIVAGQSQPSWGLSTVAVCSQSCEVFGLFDLEVYLWEFFEFLEEVKFLECFCQSPGILQSHDS